MKATALIGTFTISLYTIFLFLCTFTPAQTHHVVFEEIGEISGALSYIHVVIPISPGCSKPSKISAARLLL